MGVFLFTGELQPLQTLQLRKRREILHSLQQFRFPKIVEKKVAKWDGHANELSNIKNHSLIVKKTITCVQPRFIILETLLLQ